MRVVQNASKRIVVLISLVALSVSAAVAASASSFEQADIFGQGNGGPVVSEDGAKIRRTAGGVSASVSMVTPEPGSYMYPQGMTASGVPGRPEAFSLWVFLFFNPEACNGACDGADLQTNPDVVAGAFNAGGHLVAGPNLTISGRVNEQSAVFGGPNAETISDALNIGYRIASAEVHLAVAPHGALSPHLLPEQIKTPAGDPSYWWIVLFE